MAQYEPYPSDLSDKEWKIIKQLLPSGGKLGRPPRYEKRDILEAILYLVRQGCTWRGLPHDFPPYRIVYYYFAKWQSEGAWERINHALRDQVRVSSGKKKPRVLRLSTARVLKWLSSPENVAMTLARRSTEENDIFW
jgi:putative transposase